MSARRRLSPEAKRKRKIAASRLRAAFSECTVKSLAEAVGTRSTLNAVSDMGRANVPTPSQFRAMATVARQKIAHLRAAVEDCERFADDDAA